jgi:catechol 2,3-dioxygenase-like lactoylglutathione lyase family enzyme
LKNLQSRNLLALLLFLCTATITINAQENTKLSGFNNLIGKTWKAEGLWGDGSKFKQEITLKYALDSTIIITNSKGFINPEQTEYGNRNHGIRKYDATGKIIFWEFDVFGGVTKGTVKLEDKNILYEYEYGDSKVTDIWEYVDENTYNFKVGNYSDGKWSQVYLETQFIATEGFDFHFDHESLVVTKLIETGDFYRDVLKLREIPHPDKAQGFRWFQVRGNSQLHLIKKDVIEFSKDKSIHLCLSTQNLEGVIEHLMANNVDFYNWPGKKGAVTDRSDGVKQIYIKDPDGYWIEINTAKH